MKLKINDQVKVMLGKDRGKTGTIEKLFPKTSKILVSQVNVYKKHLKKQSERQPGGIIDLQKPLVASKVALVCPSCHQPTRIGFSLKANKKTRICRKCQKPIDKNTKKPASAKPKQGQ